MENYTVRMLKDSDETDKALGLVIDTFMEFEAPSYPEEGVNSFRSFLFDGTVKRKLADESMIMWGAYNESGEPVCVCAVRDKSHISLMFTHRDYQRRGIGRMLLQTACGYVHSVYGVSAITLNSSPYGLPFYKSFGFTPTDMECMEDGIIFTPMVYKFK